MSATQIRRAAESFQRALERLAGALMEPLDNPLALDGTIQRFEFTFELFWKLLKRLLDFEGVQVATPREALREAYNAGWIDDEITWLQMLRDRNETSHTYNEEKAREIYAHIRDSLPVVRRTYKSLCARFPTLLERKGDAVKKYPP